MGKLEMVRPNEREKAKRDVEGGLEDEERFGVVHLSEDKTYLEYSASPSSFLSLSVKKLLQLSKPESAHWPKVKWNWRILTKIVLANLLPLLLLLLIEGIFFNCRNNKLVISVCYCLFYLPVALTVSAVYRYRNIPNEYIHLCKLVRHEYIEEGDLVTDILINVATTVEPNTDWLDPIIQQIKTSFVYNSRPFGNDNK